MFMNVFTGDIVCKLTRFSKQTVAENKFFFKKKISPFLSLYPPAPPQSVFLSSPALSWESGIKMKES